MEASRSKKLFTDYLDGDVFDNYLALTEEQVNEISDMFELLIRCEESFGGSEEEKFIECRINQLISEVALANMPDWFLFIIMANATIPDSSEDLMRDKVEGLIKVLPS